MWNHGKGGGTNFTFLPCVQFQRVSLFLYFVVLKWQYFVQRPKITEGSVSEGWHTEVVLKCTWNVGRVMV